MSHPYHRKFFDFYCFVHFAEANWYTSKGNICDSKPLRLLLLLLFFIQNINNDKTYHKSHSLQLGLIQKNDVEQSVTRKMECKKVPSTVVMELL